MIPKETVASINLCAELATMGIKAIAIALYEKAYQRGFKDGEDNHRGWGL